jgi:hypothetical protein
MKRLCMRGEFSGRRFVCFIPKKAPTRVMRGINQTKDDPQGFFVATIIRQDYCRVAVLRKAYEK